MGVSLAEMTTKEWGKNFHLFFAEARKKELEGKNKTRAAPRSLRNGIERHLSTPPRNLGWRQDLRIVLSNKMPDAKIKSLKRYVLQNTAHKPAIEQEDLTKI